MRIGYLFNAGLFDLTRFDNFWVGRGAGVGYPRMNGCEVFVSTGNWHVGLECCSWPWIHSTALEVCSQVVLAFNLVSLAMSWSFACDICFLSLIFLRDYNETYHESKVELPIIRSAILWLRNCIILCSLIYHHLNVYESMFWVTSFTVAVAAAFMSKYSGSGYIILISEYTIQSCDGI